MASIGISGKQYDIPTDFTLGELRGAKRHFGAMLMGTVNATDPDVFAALAWIAINRVEPMSPDDIEALSGSDFEMGDDEVDPTIPA